MVDLADLRKQPPSDNPFIAGLLDELSFRQGYVISVVLQAEQGDSGTYGGERWAASGASTAFIQAAAAWSAVANISIEVLPDNYTGGDRSQYTWVETLTNLRPGLLGEHSLPGAAELGGDFNDMAPSFSSTGTKMGGFGFLTLLHEIGHGLGLSHPFDGPDKFPGVTDEYSPGDNGLNSLGSTIMSYNESIGKFPSDSDDYGWPATPMAFDIAAIQFLYGANLSTRTGNDVYVLPANNGPGSYWQTIWDAGGNDTISAEDAPSAATIDLRAATLRNEFGGAGWASQVERVAGGVFIANGVTIEDAIGSAFDDVITGNGASNHLAGRGGSDNISGGNGDDDIDGGDGDDHLFGDDGADRIEGGAGRDHLSGGGGDDQLHGGDGNDFLNGGGGADILEGGEGADTLHGDAGDDSMSGGPGDDWYFVDSPGDSIVELAGNGHDIVLSSVALALPDGFEDLYLTGSAALGIGNADDNLIQAGSVPATLRGGGGNDRLVGSLAADKLFGDDGNDFLVGGLGIDELDGGDGDDVLYAGVMDVDPLAGTSMPPAPPQSDGVGSILSGGAGNDMIYLDGAFGPTFTTTRDGSAIDDAQVAYASHARIDGGYGTDTVIIASRINFRGTWTSIERISFLVPDSYRSMSDALAPDSFAVLILQGAQVGLLGSAPVFLGTGTVQIELADGSDLTASGWTFDTDAQISVLISGSTLADRITGTERADRIVGGDGNDWLNGGGGDDFLDGGSGEDRAVFSGRRADYRITEESGGYRLIDLREGAPDGGDLVANVEIFAFSDGIRRAAQLVSSAPEPEAPPGFRMFAPDGFVGEIGGDGIVIGTSGFQDVAVVLKGGTVTFDPSFNKGGDVIRLPDNAGNWLIAQSGSIASLGKGDTFVRVPIGSTGLALQFDDGVRTLRVEAGVPKIGDQALGNQPEAITAQSDDLLLPASSDPSVSARVLLSAGASVAAGGRIDLFGSAAEEQVLLLSGRITLDPSFNKGGDTIAFDQPATSFLANSAGSGIALDSALLDAVIPVGSAGLTLSFPDFDSRTATYDFSVASFRIGDQLIGFAPSPLTDFA